MDRARGPSTAQPTRRRPRVHVLEHPEAQGDVSGGGDGGGGAGGSWQRGHHLRQAEGVA